MLERRIKRYGPTGLYAEMLANAIRNQERYPRWEPEQNAREKKAKGVRYLVCTDGTMYMKIPRKWGRSVQLIRVTRRGL